MVRLNNKRYPQLNSAYSLNRGHQKDEQMRHHRTNKPIIYWYKENEILKETDSVRNKPRHEAQIYLKKLTSDSNRQVKIVTKHDLNDSVLNSVLTINHAKLEDSGNYRCMFNNIQEQVTVNVLNDECKKNF